MSDLLPLQKLSFVPAPVPASDIGHRGELVWLPLSKLRIDPAYQRAILQSGKANIGRMVADFSWQLFAAIVVARRPGGVFAIIDGQHRATAALNHGGIAEVPCLVVEGGVQAEARAFGAINSNVTRVLALQSFRAKVAAGDADAVMLVDLCAEAYVKVAPYARMADQLTPGETNAIGSLRSVLRQYGRKVLVESLTALRTLDDSAGLSSPAILGAGAALGNDSDLMAKAVRLASKIAGAGKLAVLEQKALARKHQRGGVLQTNFAAVFKEALHIAERTGGQDMSRLMGRR